MHLEAETAQQGADAVTVGVVDLPGQQCLAGLAQFVAAAQQADAQAPTHRDRGDAETRQQAEFLRAQALSGTQHRRAATQLLAAPAHMLAGAHRRQLHALAVDHAEFLRHHAVGAGRQRRAGEDPRRLAQRQAHAAGVAGGDPRADRQAAAAARQVGGAQGVAVHRTVVPMRQVHRRQQVLAEHSSQRPLQGQALAGWRARRARQQSSGRSWPPSQAQALTSGTRSRPPAPRLAGSSGAGRNCTGGCGCPVAPGESRSRRCDRRPASRAGSTPGYRC